MILLVARAMVRFELQRLAVGPVASNEWSHLIQERSQLFRAPSFRLPRVKVRSLTTGVDHPVDRTATPESTA